VTLLQRLSVGVHDVELDYAVMWCFAGAEKGALSKEIGYN
jgi:hypothetical protein